MRRESLGMRFFALTVAIALCTLGVAEAAGAKQEKQKNRKPAKAAKAEALAAQKRAEVADCLPQEGETVRPEAAMLAQTTR